MVDSILICWTIFALYWILSSFFVKESAVKRNWFFSILWRVLLIGTVILLFTSYKPTALLFLDSSFKSYFQFKIFGLILSIIGLIITIWARISLGKNWSSYVTYKEKHELVTSGPYKLVRHPIYSGLILMLIGTFVYYGSIFVLAILIIFGIMFLLRMKKEEKIMVELFGKKYENYMKSSKRIIPFVY